MVKKMIVSYERVSSIGQNVGRQTHGLNSLQTFDRTYQDKVSGSVPFSERPSGRRLMDDVSRGLIETIYFWECSRIGRDVADIHNTLKFFSSHGVQVIIHKENIRLLNDDGTANQTAQLVLSVMAALSDIERQNIRERMMEGIALARIQGKYVGRRKGTTESIAQFLSKPKSRKIVQMLKEGHKKIHISAILGVSHNTIAKVEKSLQETL